MRCNLPDCAHWRNQLIVTISSYARGRQRKLVAADMPGRIRCQRRRGFWSTEGPNFCIGEDKDPYARAEVPHQLLYFTCNIRQRQAAEEPLGRIQPKDSILVRTGQSGARPLRIRSRKAVRQPTDGMVTAEDRALRSKRLKDRLYPRLSLLRRPRHPKDTFDGRDLNTDVFASARVNPNSMSA
jgi:hypothetical protein